MVKKWHKQNNNEFYDFSKKDYALPKQVSSLMKQTIRESCSQ